MTHLFSVLLEQSLTACWVIPAVLLLRFCLKKAPKRVTNLLWLVVAFRLVCPVSFESNVSLVTQAQNLSHAAAELRDEIEAYRPVDTHPTITLPEDMVFDTPVTPETPVLPENPALPIIPESPEAPEIVIPPVETPREQPFISQQLVLQAGCGLWLAGVAAMALFGLLSTLQWRKRVQTAVRCEDGLWRSENVESPFILGVLRPKIYLPFVLPFGAESHVIAHEQAHLKRRDPLWKCFAFVLLAVYWFHPLVWVSYFLFCRDIELACDQQVTRNLDAEGKKAYSRALLACTVSRDPLLCPLSFGEVGVKARVKAVLRKKPGKLLTLTALALCTVLIICCAANPKEEHPWDEAYRQTLEELLKQYGANEDYGLQSVTTLDLWEDGVPELLVVRKVDTTDVGEDEIIVYLYEYVDGLVQPRAKQYVEGDAEIQWKPVEEGIQIMGSWPLTDRSSYPAVQSMEALRIINLPNQNGYYSVVSRDYLQIDDGRWIIKYPSYSSESSRFLTEEETAALLDGAQSLMGLDYNGFLRKHKGINGQGVTCYQSAFADAVDYVVDDGICYHAVLTDMDLDGYPEMLAASEGKLWLVQYTPGEKTVAFDRTGEKHTLYATALPWEVGYRYGDDQRKPFTVTVLNGRPVAVIGLSGDGSDERLFILEMVDGALKNWSMEATAPVGANGQRDLLYDHQINGQPVSAEEYEELAAKLVTGTLVEHDINDIPWSISGYLNTGLLRKSGYPILEVPQPTDYPGYRKVLTDLIAHYGCYDTGDGTLPVLGLKYAALHDFGEDGSPELITLVNHKDDDQQLHMTLRIYGCDGGDTVLRYTTELGARYGQTDVSYTFTLGENFVATYHSQNEWTQEVIRITEHLSQDTPYTRVYRASRELSDDPPEEGTLTQFWENGEAVSLGYYGTIMQGTVDRGRHIDACWNVSPAGKTELMVFLEQMGVRTDAPSGYGETVAAAHHSRLSGLMTVHGTTPDGIVGATIVDLEQDDVPELLVQHGMTLELYRYEKNHSRLIWSGDIGLYFGQSDVSNEYVINTHGEQPCIIVYDAEESWTEEVLRVITLKDGVIGEEVLRAWTDDKNAFFPERENLDQFTNNGKVISKAEYDTQRTQLVAGGMWVAAYHPHAFPNSDEYMAQLLDDLAAGKLPTVSDSAVQAMTFWLMGSNDGDPLDEETASAFAAVFSREIEGRVPCFEDVPIHWTQSHSPEIDNEYFEFCRYIQGKEEDWLILVDQDDITYVCKGIACRLDEKGVLRVAAGVVDVDTFSASLVGDFDGQTLVHRRYHTDCYSGMEGCEDCFRSDLVLWNADRTESVKLVENEPLAELFTVISRDERWVYVTYQTGPSHSEYNQQTTLRINLEEKTCVQVGREGLTDSPNVLMTSYPHVDDPYTAPLHAVMDNASTALLPQAWDERQLWLALEFPDREHWTLYRNGQTVYGVNRDGQTKRLDPVCIELIEAMGMEHPWGTVWDYARRLHKPTGFVLKIDGQPVAVGSDFAMLDWFGANHSLMLDVEQLGELLNVPVEITNNAILTQPEGLQASLDYYGTWISVTDGKQSSEVRCFYNPATFEGRHYIPADALRGLFSVAMTWSEQQDVWTLELTTLSALKAMAADAAAQLGAVYTPRGPMEDRLMVGYQTVVDYGGGQALMNFLPDLNRPIFDLGPVLHRMTMLDRGYLRTYESNGKVTQSLYAQAISYETIPLEYDEIVCIDQRVQLYSLKKNGKYGFAVIPWGNYEATISPCQWEKPMTITEMCGAMASYSATGEW